MGSVKAHCNGLATVHIPVRCAVLHGFCLFHSYARTFCILHLDVESVMISVPKKATESEWFGQFCDYLCLTDVLSSRGNDTVSAAADGRRNRRYVGYGRS